MTGKRAALLSLLFFSGAKPALAHSPIEGIGDFYNGLLHPLLTPAHLLLLVALGLLLGRAGIRKSRFAFGVLMISTPAGLALTGALRGVDVQAPLLFAAAIIGLLIAGNGAPGRVACAGIAAVAGFLVSVDSPAEGLTGSARFLALLGTGLGVLLLPLYAMGFADYFGAKPWQRIGLRVIGSWLAACSLLVLSLSLSRVMA